MPKLDNTTPTYIEVDVTVRFWEDATVNGVSDIDGSLISGRKGDSWTAIIRLRDGYVLDWPSGCVADIFYMSKSSTYWLLDADKKRLAQWAGHLAPDDFLRQGARAPGDCHLILNIDANGFIQKWRMPSIDWVEDCADAPQRGWLALV